jgi:pyruvate formate lyase activating enzyme
MRSSAAPRTRASADVAPHVKEGSGVEATGVVFDIQRFSVHDGPGIRTIVFLKSCALRCLWCSNPESQRIGPELMYSASSCLRCGTCVGVCARRALRLTEGGIEVDNSRCTVCGDCAAVCPGRALRVSGRSMTVDQVLAEVERDHVFYAHSGGGMTLSGGEPLLQPDFATGVLHEARNRGIHSAVETAGSADATVVKQVLGSADLILYDIKHMNSEKHLAGTGAPNELILQSARVASALGVPMVIRTPVIPGFNDQPAEIAAIGRFALSLGLREMHLLPYHRYGVPKYAGLRRRYEIPDLRPPSPEHLEGLRRELADLGLDVHLGG